MASVHCPAGHDFDTDATTHTVQHKTRHPEGGTLAVITEKFRDEIVIDPRIALRQNAQIVHPDTGAEIQLPTRMVAMNGDQVVETPVVAVEYEEQGTKFVGQGKAVDVVVDVYACPECGTPVGIDRKHK